METHAHHLHKAPGNKFWHYFFEFLMLFLAVFCGFVAENFREEKAEHNREKQYMQSMIEDLARDTLEIAEVALDIDSFFLPVFKNATDFLYRGDFSDSSVNKMYEYIPSSITFLTVNFEDRTINQLKNSGNLRMIRNNAVTDSLAEYWQLCGKIKDPYLKGYAEARSHAKDLAYSLFDMQYSQFYHRGSNTALSKSHESKLISNDRAQVIKLANYIDNLQIQSSRTLKPSILDAKSKASNLIKLIKKEYNI